MKRTLLLSTFSLTALFLTSCGIHRTAGGGEIALLHEGLSMFSPNSPLYYKGRKNNFDYFMFYASGRKMNVKCPVETSFIKTPQKFNSKRSGWKDVSQMQKPSFMPEIMISPVSVSE